MVRSILVGVLLVVAVGCDKDPKPAAKPAKADPLTDPWTIVFSFSGGKPPGMTYTTRLDSDGKYSSQSKTGNDASSCTATIEKAALRPLEEQLRLDYAAWPSEPGSEKDRRLDGDGRSETFFIGGRGYAIPSSANRDELSKIFQLAEQNCH